MTSKSIHTATANRASSLLYSFIKERPKGTWLLPVNVCPDIPLTFCLANVPFQFVDIDPFTLYIDIEKCKSIISKCPSQYVGIVFVRTYGYLSDVSPTIKILRSDYPSLQIIDDRCLCYPEAFPDLQGADMVLYSTGHCKPIDLGQGGLAFYSSSTSFRIDPTLVYDGTNEEKLYKEAFLKGERLCPVPKGWLKMDTFLDFTNYIKEIDYVKERITIHRNKLNTIYQNLLSTSIQLSKDYQNWRFNIIVSPSEKRKILNKLFENGLFASSHYQSVNYLFDNHKFPHSDSLFDHIINLFNDFYYTECKAIKTCEIINQVVS